MVKKLELLELMLWIKIPQEVMQFLLFITIKLDKVRLSKLSLTLLI